MNTGVDLKFGGGQYMKFIKDKNNDGWWDLILDNAVIGNIQPEYSVSPRRKGAKKVLYIGDTRIGEVANQKDALQKASEAIRENKESGKKG